MNRGERSKKIYHYTVFSFLIREGILLDTPAVLEISVHFPRSLFCGILFLLHISSTHALPLAHHFLNTTYYILYCVGDDALLILAKSSTKRCIIPSATALILDTHGSARGTTACLVSRVSALLARCGAVLFSHYGNVARRPAAA